MKPDELPLPAPYTWVQRGDGYWFITKNGIAVHDEDEIRRVLEQPIALTELAGERDAF